MSLLLDALQRASKDKEKAASAGATVPPTHTPELSLTANDAKDSHATPLPVLVHEVIAPVVQVAPAQKLQPEPELSLAPQLPKELTLDFAAVPAPAQAQPPQATSPVFGATFGAHSGAAAQPTLALASTAPSPGAAAPVPAQPAAPAPPTTSPSSSPSPSRVAQDMRRAYAPVAAPAAGRRRALVVAGIAIALAVVAAGLLMKVWEGTTPSVAVVQPTSAEVSAPAPVAPVEQAVAVNVSAPVPADVEQPLGVKTKVVPVLVGSQTAAQAPVRPPAPATSPASSSALVATPPAASATPVASTEKSNEVLVQPGAGSQTFASKIRGASPLEVGYAALVAGRLEDAAQAYIQALKANSEERDALLGLAYIAQKRGQREEAQALYRRVLRQEPGNAIASAALLGLDSENDNSQTASRAKDLALRQPDSAPTMAMAGNAAVREGLLADAVQMFARAQFLEPANPLYAYNHAVALDRLGQFAPAAAQYERVLKLSDPAAPAGGRGYSVDAVKERLAQLRQALGAPADAVK